MFFESIKIALEGLRANKLRSILTMLGIIIGVGAVVAMVSIGLGVQQKVQNSISSLGSNLLIVTPGATGAGGVRSAAGSSKTLTPQDAKAIAKLDGVKNVAPTVQSSFQLAYGNKNWNSRVQGVTPNYMEVRDLKTSIGAFFSEGDETSRNRVAVLGNTVATNLFGEANPVGQTIRVGNAPFLVIGVLESKGQSASGQDNDDLVLIPFTTAQERLLGITHVQSISVQAENENVITQVQQEITSLLRSRHRIQNDKDDDFSVNNLTAVLDTMKETTGTITLFLASVAAISLIVGGIGIMNIMLTSVVERTREIGIRKALGATYRIILLQFMIEAVVISVTGGIMGILLGIGSAQVISMVAGWNTVVSPLSVFMAFSVSVAIGLFFGIYPARQAALLDPIEALRHE